VTSMVVRDRGGGASEGGAKQPRLKSFDSKKRCGKPHASRLKLTSREKGKSQSEEPLMSADSHRAAQVSSQGHASTTQRILKSRKGKSKTEKSPRNRARKRGKT